MHKLHHAMGVSHKHIHHYHHLKHHLKHHGGAAQKMLTPAEMSLKAEGAKAPRMALKFKM